VRATLHTWALDGIGELTELLTSELVTNAVLHSGGPITLWVEGNPDAIRVAVGDRGAARPMLQSVGEGSDHGRGIRIVDEVATRWGTELADDDGKVVWFEIDIDPTSGDHNPLEA
jgi:anti-sigma regulatory factor (Ser/Thr protein kinase)